MSVMSLNYFAALRLWNRDTPTWPSCIGGIVVSEENGKLPDLRLHPEINSSDLLLHNTKPCQTYKLVGSYFMEGQQNDEVFIGRPIFKYDAKTPPEATEVNARIEEDAIKFDLGRVAGCAFVDSVGVRVSVSGIGEDRFKREFEKR